MLSLRIEVFFSSKVFASSFRKPPPSHPLAVQRTLVRADLFILNIYWIIVCFGYGCKKKHAPKGVHVSKEVSLSHRSFKPISAVNLGKSANRVETNRTTSFQPARTRKGLGKHSLVSFVRSTNEFFWEVVILACTFTCAFLIVSIHAFRAGVKWLQGDHNELVWWGLARVKYGLKAGSTE